MKFSLDKILAAFGNVRAMERTHVDDHTEAIINDIENKPFAVSDSDVLYVGVNELGGYHFMQTVIIGSFHIKTKKGAKLLISGKEIDLNLKSDMMEFESDKSNISNRSITRIDFQLEENMVSLIDKELINTLELNVKKHKILFYALNEGYEK